MSLIQKLRSFKIADISVFDFLGTMFFGILIGLCWFFLQPQPNPHLHWFIIFATLLLFLFGIAVHYMMGISTMGNYYLGLNSKVDVLKQRRLQANL